MVHNLGFWPVPIVKASQLEGLVEHRSRNAVESVVSVADMGRLGFTGVFRNGALQASVRRH
jgi:hypothetical protein